MTRRDQGPSRSESGSRLTAAYWERELRAVGLGDLDGPSGMVSSRGAGKSKAAGRDDELARRKALLDNYVFPSRHREIYHRWADGETQRAIAIHFRVCRKTIHKSIRRTERNYAAQQANRPATPLRVRHRLLTPAEQMSRLVLAADHSLIALTIGLIRRAVTHPDEMAALADKAEDTLP